MYKFFLGFVLWIIPFSISAQRTLSGRVTDVDDGSPIHNAAVFIDNTTVGTTTDTEGKYQLKLPGEGSYRLAISHVAYQPVFVDIEPGKTSKTINISLKVYEMKEVTVSAKTRFRSKDIELFWTTILGMKPGKKTMQPTNPEAVYYYYNSKTEKLTVTCRVPLQIINHETGFHIQYVLNYFTHDYKSNISSWEGQYLFAALEPANYKQKNIWKENREKIYRSSITNFIKALHQNSTLEDGFLFTFKEKQDDSSKERVVNDGIRTYTLAGVPNYAQGANYKLIDSDYLLVADSASGRKTLYIPPEWDVMLISFGKPVTKWNLENAKGTRPWEMIGLFRNHIVTPDGPVHIFSDGSYMNPMRLTPVFSSNSLSGLNMLLPTDYRPDGENDATGALAENEPSEEIHPVDPLTDSLMQVAQRFDRQLSLFPQEKLYLHTDKPYYVSGERIWFRAHVVDAATHVPEFTSGSVYVELFDARDSVVCRVKTGAANDLFSGYIAIPEETPEGDYTLRAYTNRMQNLDEDYFFVKNIRIGNPMSRIIQTKPEFEFLTDQKIGAGIRFSRIRPLGSISPESVKISINDEKPMNIKCENGASGFSFNLPNTEKQRTMLLDVMHEKHPFRQYIKIPFPDDDFDVSFYPEGGAALAGCLGRIAFKAIQRDGTEINVTGVVYDQQGNEVTLFKTEARGMGVISMKHKQGDRYYVVCTNDKGQSKRFDLPAAQENGYALSSTWSKDRLTVQVCQPEHQVADTLCLLVHTRGVVQDVRVWEKTSVPVVFTKDFFPSGVSHLLLLTKDMVPISERLIFVSNETDHAKVESTRDKESYSARSAIEYTVNITDESGEPLLGNFSVSVTDNYAVTVDTTANILTSLLLSSDLRGHIPDAAYFFRKKDLATVYALDLLMLTQGWRRYDTERIVKNNLMYPDTLLEKGYDLSGTVRYFATKRPVENAGVSILSFTGGFSEGADTDREGRFYLQSGEIYDSTRLVIQTSPQLGRQNLELTLNKPSYPKRSIPVVASGAPDREQFAQYADKVEQQYVDEHGTRTYQLSDVTITAPKKKIVDYSFFYKADVAAVNITEEELDKYPAVSMNSLIFRLPGVTIADEKIIYPGRNVILRVDDINVNDDDVFRLNVSDIAQIDFITNQGIADMFKKYSTMEENPMIRNVLISIHTKRGKPNAPKETHHIKPVMPLGFQRPAEFYAPKYDTPAQKQKPDLRTTIHWQPNITTDENGTATFSFYTADAPSTYTVVMEGMTMDGKIVYKKERIVVKD